MAAFYEYGDLDGKVNAYVAKGLCETSNNGQCIRDPDFQLGRLYTVRVAVVDETGRSNDCQARALVLRRPLYDPNFDFAGVADSTQLFLLTEHKHTIKETE
mmetsp:Transcript_3065/g.5436  ORF Transcript_3065/g.5436 Transcript_3065/m.5436 type:complete len:101 (+) Transcript_3065:1680-1982(+)